MTIRPESGPLSAASRMKISNRAETAPNPYGVAGIRAGSMPKGDRPIVLYPAYFALGRTREQGRRVAERWAGESPTGRGVSAAARGRRLPPDVGEEKPSPST